MKAKSKHRPPIHKIDTKLKNIQVPWALDPLYASVLVPPKGVPVAGARNFQRKAALQASSKNAGGGDTKRTWFTDINKNGIIDYTDCKN